MLKVGHGLDHISLRTSLWKLVPEKRGYVNESGKGDNVDYFFSMPPAFCGKVVEE